MHKLHVRPPGREVFFAPLLVRLSPDSVERITFAYEASKAGHAKQFRKDGKTRFFDHPKGAAWIYIDELGGRDPEIIINTLLHDMREDSHLLSLHRIALNFGEERALDIFALTKLAKGAETTHEYLGRIIRRGPPTIISKLCDRLQNSRDILSCKVSEIQKLVEETEQYHLPLLVTALKQQGNEWVAIAQALEQKLCEAMTEAKRRIAELGG